MTGYTSQTYHRYRMPDAGYVILSVVDAPKAGLAPIIALIMHELGKSAIR